MPVPVSDTAHPPGDGTEPVTVTDTCVWDSYSRVMQVTFSDGSWLFMFQTQYDAIRGG